MDADSIPVLRPLLPSVERLLSYLRRIDQAREYTNWGPLASELETRLATLFGVPPGSVVSAGSGTSALTGAILAAAGGPLDRRRPFAMVPSFTFVATAVAIERCGFRPYLADVDPVTWQMRTETVASHPRLDEIGLVVPVAAFGRPVPQAPWRRFQESTGIPVVIDGGASFEAVVAGPRALVGGVPVALSFHATKSFSTAEGGCVVTADKQAAETVTRSLNFGFHESRNSRGPSINGKMSEYHAAVGLAELDGWNEKQAAIGRVAEAYRCAARKQGIADRVIVAPEVAGCYALFVGTDAGELDRVRASLERCHIDVRAWYGLGVHTQPHFHDARRDPLPVTDRIAPFVVGLPTAPDLSAAAVDRVAAALAAGINARR